MTQPQSLERSALSSPPTTGVNIDLPLRSPKMMKFAITADKQLHGKPRMRKSPPIKLEDSKAIGLGIHIPVSRPPYIDVAKPLPCPMPASWYDQDLVSQTLCRPYVYIEEEAKYLQQSHKDELSEVWKPLPQRQTTADRTWHHHQGIEWVDGGNIHGCLYPGFYDSGPRPEVHQTASDEPQRTDRSHLNDQDPTPSDNDQDVAAYEDIGLFDVDSIMEQWDVGINDGFVEED
ncbi:MAG: hypothetical protein Q9213_000686 [Squamulea squamosa]